MAFKRSSVRSRSAPPTPELIARNGGRKVAVFCFKDISPSVSANLAASPGRCSLSPRVARQHRHLHQSRRSLRRLPIEVEIERVPRCSRDREDVRDAFLHEPVSDEKRSGSRLCPPSRLSLQQREDVGFALPPRPPSRVDQFLQPRPRVRLLRPGPRAQSLTVPAKRDSRVSSPNACARWTASSAAYGTPGVCSPGTSAPDEQRRGSPGFKTARHGWRRLVPESDASSGTPHRHQRRRRQENCSDADGERFPESHAAPSSIEFNGWMWALWTFVAD
jgi:hypothetical protein